MARREKPPKKGNGQGGIGSSRPPGLFQSALYKTRQNVDIMIESLQIKDSSKIMSFHANGGVLGRLRPDWQQQGVLRTSL
jgi:hypothetical protein